MIQFLHYCYFLFQMNHTITNSRPSFSFLKNTIILQFRLRIDLNCIFLRFIHLLFNSQLNLSLRSTTQLINKCICINNLKPFLISPSKQSRCLFHTL
jgi:hypothetical protein